MGPEERARTAWRELAALWLERRSFNDATTVIADAIRAAENDALERVARGHDDSADHHAALARSVQPDRAREHLAAATAYRTAAAAARSLKRLASDTKGAA